MKRNVISKEIAENLKIEPAFTYYEVFSTSLLPKSLELNTSEINLEELKRINTALDQYFLYRDEQRELRTKFVDFFDDEFKKERTTTLSSKFVDYIIGKPIATSSSPANSNLSKNQESQQQILEGSISRENNDSNLLHRIIRDENGDVKAIEVKCKCGELIRIELEFE
ncbi:MAG: hypothetical protein N2517_08130 [Ignavibacteria bacterium]|nr:hypothetical protein [Ignavibacteria bacterium]